MNIFFPIKIQSREMAKLRGKKRARSVTWKGDSPAAKKLANGNNSDTDAESEMSLADPVLSEESTFEEDSNMTQDDNLLVRFEIISSVALKFQRICFIDFILNCRPI